MHETKKSSREISIEEVKYNFEQKKYDNVIFLTNHIFKNKDCNDFAMKTRFYCLMQREEYTKIIHEITYCLIKNSKEKTFKDIFQENYTKIRDKNLLFELLYSMYKLGKYKKLNGCLKFFLEHETKYDDFINVLLAQVNFKLRNFELCVNSYEILLNDKINQSVATINLHSSLFSMYMNLLYEYNFLRQTKNRSRVVEYEDIENLKQRIKKITKNFKYDENDVFEHYFNYSIFFTIEKKYPEAIKCLDLLENVCKHLLIKDTNNSKDLEGANIAEINSKRILIQLLRAYIYSETNKIKESIAIYENILNNYYENINNLVVLLSYNNYMAIMHNEINKNSDKKSNSSLIFNINNDKLNQIKSFIFMNKDTYTERGEMIKSIVSFNECLSYLNADKKDDFKIKLRDFSIRFSNSILLDKLNILTYKNENYMKCKDYLLNIINLMHSKENKIKFINAYISLCYEKRSYKEILKIYLKYEDIFENNVNDYSIFFSNMFYIYICIKHTENLNFSHSGNINNLNLVIDFFEKYKENIKKNINIVNYETLFLVSKYLIYHKKSELLMDIFDYLSKEVKNNLNFFSCYTYISTYINLNNAYKYEDKLKKYVLSETYLIDVEELENKSITFDLTMNNEINSASVEKNKRKRKRKKKKYSDVNLKDYDYDKWLPKYEKAKYKKYKKKKKKGEIAPTKIVTVEESKNQINQSKLQKLKKRRKK